MTTEVWCRNCSNHGFLKRPPRDNEACPTCDQPLMKRRDGSPTPWNHLSAVLKALVSIRAVLFVGLYALAVEIPHPIFRVAIAVLLFLGATSFASKAASVGADRYIEFPHINFEELLSIRAIFSMAVYVLVLVLGPVFLVVSAVAVNVLPFELGFVPPVWLAVSLAAALFLWSPMALVLYLRTNSVIGFFLVPQGIRLMLLNIRGYILLSLLVLFAQGMLVAVYVANSFVPFPLTIVLSVMKAVLILTAYACAGLYVRQQARILDFPIDTDDWIPIAPPVEVNFSDLRSFRPTDPSRAIELEDDDAPVVPPQFLRTHEMGPGGGSWPPQPVLSAAPAPQSVSDRARDAGLAPLKEGEWLSGDAEVNPYQPADAGPSVATETAFPAIGGEALDLATPLTGKVPSKEKTQSWVAQIDPGNRAPDPLGTPPAPAAPLARVPTDFDLHREKEEPSTVRESDPSTDALGRYKLERKVAEGGMAEIFLASQQGPADYRKPVVIKRMRRQLASEPEIVQMFLDEARLGAQLNHPNIVQVIDFGEANGEYFIAMERLNGLDFGELLAKGPIPVDIACLLISQACEGLAYAHRLTNESGESRGVVHRDISPANLFLARPGVVKVLDFGIARATERNTKTQTGMVKGKPAFMSPEQVRGQPLDGRSDVFSLGTTLYEIVTNVSPFFRASDFDTGAAVVQERQPELSSFDLTFPPGFESALKGALKKHVDKRYADTVALRTALKPFLPAGSPNDVLQAFLTERTP